ncbi:MAG: hypothetical protein QM500_00910 [Methylococcales bacterium]
MNNKRKLISIISLVLATTSIPSFADDDYSNSDYPQSQHIEGTNITGPNDFCGHVIYTFPQPFPNIRLAFMGQLNTDPDATDAIPLSDENCEPDTILATTTDPVFLAFNQGEDTEQILKNLPIRDIPVYVNRNGLRAHLALKSEGNNLYPVRFASNTKDDITLGQWLSAEGKMKIKCESNASAEVEFSFSSLIPNSLYTVWGWYKTVPPGETEATFVVLPLGGVPNVVTTDKKGHAKGFERYLSYCPMNTTEDGSELLSVVVTWHPDGAVYGAAPSVDFVRGDYLDKNGSTIVTNFPVGVIGQDQMMFPVRLMEN